MILMIIESLNGFMKIIKENINQVFIFLSLALQVLIRSLAYWYGYLNICIEDVEGAKLRIKSSYYWVKFVYRFYSWLFF